jgi:hypothetical protein
MNVGTLSVVEHGLIIVKDKHGDLVFLSLRNKRYGVAWLSKGYDGR